MQRQTSMESTKVWSPALVEELLFREFIKEENISGYLPPAPKVNDENYLEQYDQATRILFSYVRNGPVTALAAHNVNTTLNNRLIGQNNRASYKGTVSVTVNNTNNASITPSKGLTNRSPQPKTGIKVEAPSMSPPLSAPVTVMPASTSSINTTITSATTVTHSTANVTTAAPNLSRTHARTPTPISSQQPSRSTSALKSITAASAAELPTALPKHLHIEWPADVPTNNALKSNSRSKVAHLTAKRAAAQENIDPDLIFASNNEELPLQVIFASFPQALSSISSVRKASGDWRSDTFTKEEEQLYKKEMHFTYIGQSQCQLGNWPA